MESEWKKYPVWRCMSRLDHGARYCKKSPSLKEKTSYSNCASPCNLIEYNDLVVRKTIECIKVISKNKLLIIFKGGYEVYADIE